MSNFNLQNEMIYKFKYIKYKNKYINLKNKQEGGVIFNSNTSILFYNQQKFPQIENIITNYKKNIEAGNEKECIAQQFIPYQDISGNTNSGINGLNNIYEYKIIKNNTRFLTGNISNEKSICKPFFILDYKSITDKILKIITVQTKNIPNGKTILNKFNTIVNKLNSNILVYNNKIITLSFVNTNINIVITTDNVESISSIIAENLLNNNNNLINDIYNAFINLIIFIIEYFVGRSSEQCAPIIVSIKALILIFNKFFNNYFNGFTSISDDFETKNVEYFITLNKIKKLDNVNINKFIIIKNLKKDIKVKNNRGIGFNIESLGNVVKSDTLTGPSAPNEVSTSNEVSGSVEAVSS